MKHLLLFILKLVVVLLMLVLLFSPYPLKAQAALSSIQGRVFSLPDSLPLPGAAVVVAGSTNGTICNAEGAFTLQADFPLRLVCSFIGYAPAEVALLAAQAQPLLIYLREDAQTLNEVVVLSTGYQDLPPERTTGSFASIDQKLLNRATSPDLLSRLEGQASGVAFTAVGSDKDISIRGVSTLFANKAPLIVIDNFPYDGDIRNINPNDVESITVLKDAAAASIWGARAGNGVIVISTKKGLYGQKPKFSFHSNFTQGQTLDPFYVPRMSVADHIATERQLFEEGYYAFDETAADKPPLSPVLELLIAEREGHISSEELQRQLQVLAGQDVRHDFAKHLYQKSFYQQYALSMQGGSARQRYFISAGYDQNLENKVGDAYRRVSLNMRNTWNFLNEKLQLQSDQYYVQSLGKQNSLDPSQMNMSAFSGYAPYAQLATAQGEALPLTKDFRGAFIEQAAQAGLLDWSYTPLRERELIDRQNQLDDIRSNWDLQYKIFPSLSVSAKYQYWKGLTEQTQIDQPESYFARDLVNRYTQTLPNGSLQRAIPLGGIMDLTQRQGQSHTFRAQTQFSKAWPEKHEVHALAGWEIKRLDTDLDRSRFYGYEHNKARSAPVDYITRFPQYFNTGRLLTIPFLDVHQYLSDRFVSFYANGAYTYANRYIVNLSARKDQSNLFGVKANQRAVPLWSVGLGWQVHEEAFYPLKTYLPYLKIRGTYGFNGNIDKSVTAYTTARTGSNSSITGLPAASITNPPNPELGWEQIEVLNWGIDWASPGQRISGSFEWFQKNGQNLIGFTPISGTTGQTSFKGNVANTEGRGFDLTLRTLNIDRAFQWSTQWLLSKAETLVSHYKAESTANLLVTYASSGSYPREGYPLYALYSYRWAGLNPDNGNPQGFIGTEKSENYLSLVNGATPDSLVYQGAARPTTFGALMNTFQWKGLSLSFNIGYSFGYYFRRPSIVYGFEKGLGGHGDYALRWQEPGDEKYTQVPSIPESPSTPRDNFYRYSEVLVEKGDHIRLQDINLSYTLSPNHLKALPFEQVQVYAYARNLGILWKASKAVADPDYLQFNLPRSFSLGLRLHF